MRRMMLTALIVLLALLLGGCQDTGEVENQAYVLVLALDGGGNGELALTVRVPRIGQSGAQSGKDDHGNSPYLTFSVSAPSWSQALDALQWATPRRINLSHIEMIVASEGLASQTSFASLMNDMADTPHLYTNARFVICKGSARAFLEAGETVIGTRLSSEIHTMLSQYARQGFIPDTCLADACYCANGIYGDPIAIWGDPADAGSENDVPISVTESPMRQRFSGAALFLGGRYVRALSKRETRLLNLIRGQCGTLAYSWRNRIIELPLRSSAPKARIEEGDITLLLRLKLGVPGSLAEKEITALQRSIHDDIARLVGDCQRLGIDPFGFAESAASHFRTVSDWMAFDWRSRFVGAPLDVEVTLSKQY